MYWILLQVVALFTLLYFYINRKYSYWSSRGVKGPRAIFPFGYLHTRAMNRPDYLEKQYWKKYGNLYGVYTGLLPTLTIADPELIKQVFVKDFHLYVNRRFLNPYNRIFNRNIFNLESEEWKRVRSIISPAFTSGKLKGMFAMMNVAIDKLMTYMNEKTKGDGLINTKEVISGFTIDVIASTAFATDTNANDDRSKTNDFVYHGMNMFNFNPLKVVANLMLPRKILTFMGITHFFPEDSFDFFADLATNIVQQRKKGNFKRNDLIQLMIDAHALEADDGYDNLMATMEEDETTETVVPKPTTASKAKKTLDETEIISQCIIFFMAGFETTASTLTHTIFELAHNPEIQDRLLKEISAIAEETDVKNLSVYFDKLLNHAHYLDSAIKECLRKYPPVVRLERRVGAEGVKLGGVPLDKDTLIEIPCYAVQHNPEFYPEPDKYNPDRFMPENKHLLVPYTFLPFGDGPRNCIGMRFAYQEIKLCLAQIIQQYSFSLAPNTPEKLIFKRGSPMLNSEQFYVKITKR